RSPASGPGYSRGFLGLEEQVAESGEMEKLQAKVTNYKAAIGTWSRQTNRASWLELQITRADNCLRMLAKHVNVLPVSLSPSHAAAAVAWKKCKAAPSPEIREMPPMLSIWIKRFVIVAFSCLLAAMTGTSARAEVRTLEIISRQPFAEGEAFGEAGPYEKIV